MFDSPCQKQKQIEILVKLPKLKSLKKSSQIELNSNESTEWVRKLQSSKICVATKTAFVFVWVFRVSVQFLGDWTIETDPELLCFPSTTAELHKTNCFYYVFAVVHFWCFGLLQFVVAFNFEHISGHICGISRLIWQKIVEFYRNSLEIDFFVGMLIYFNWKLWQILRFFLDDWTNRNSDFCEF